MNERQAPFKTLGTHLRYLREQLKESLAEVSGAVEIDERSLQRIEAGEERPAEDILLLLISHFDMPDQEAVQLWESAGYGGEVPDQLKALDDLQATSKPVVMVVALDARTMYTDGIEVVNNPGGITMNFSQTGIKGEPVPVARLGMSLEQAEQVMRALHHGLMNARYAQQPKALPPQSGCPHSEHEHLDE